MKPTAKMLAIPSALERGAPRTSDADVKAAFEAEARTILARASAAKVALSPAGLMQRLEAMEHVLEKIVRPPALGVRAKGAADGNVPGQEVWNHARDRAIARIRDMRERLAKRLEKRIVEKAPHVPEREGDRTRVDESLFTRALDQKTRALDEQSPRKKD